MAARAGTERHDYRWATQLIEPNTLLSRISVLKPKGRRTLLAIAGPPGAGKSTLAETLVSALGETAALVPMDGFHIDNRILERRGLLTRKGAPETFDSSGFLAMVRRLAEDDEVYIPTFDRTKDIAVAGADVVGPEQSIAVVEGNYLLLGIAPWRGLGDLWDFSVFLDVPMEVLRQRLVQRWLDQGLDSGSAVRRAEVNDLPNARLVRNWSAAADSVFRTV
ncbi:MAG: nucleoside triphosphate hydrolase [Rhodobacter sp.]|nr:nucleoside triphosphate hydrolase [Rhodobacter sp.]MCY4168026.1 nucleoside triphosphate hydrolase [Rhodobacter sp.]MCY4242233.1 nucleoside triphosphate hydrolase [Rhodobacter sp.]